MSQPGRRYEALGSHPSKDPAGSKPNYGQQSCNITASSRTQAAAALGAATSKRYHNIARRHGVSGLAEGSRYRGCRGITICDDESRHTVVEKTILLRQAWIPRSEETFWLLQVSCGNGDTKIDDTILDHFGDLFEYSLVDQPVEWWSGIPLLREGNYPRLQGATSRNPKPALSTSFTTNLELNTPGVICGNYLEMLLDDVAFRDIVIVTVEKLEWWAWKT
ncbi:hypothetical protein K490DRAFT_60634 [Saccharata proteae CBS 121410]|uniref:Uncharacterized protein n=1 Tax=Saccharata proteae CBS 121410 TaxID=1314787 RepID=A0A9P4LT05_9PEZI|nr:hypothetical protein K490DRAFT_60634 [Saccharata proteae CBS 121410]